MCSVYTILLTVPLPLSQIPVTLAHNVRETQQRAKIINPEHESFHGCIRGPVAISRLKATYNDSFLVRYSEKQKKYLLTVLKRGLGDDEDGDLVKEFEIVICDNRKKCKVSGLDEKFSSLEELLFAYKARPLHASIMNIGKCCESPRHRERLKEKEEMLVSQISKASASKMLTQLQTQDHKRMDEMEAKILTLEKKKRCVIS